MSKLLFFVLNIIGMLLLGGRLLNWWVSINDAGLINSAVAAITSVLVVALLVIQVIYVGDALFSKEKESQSVHTKWKSGSLQ